MNTLIIGRVEDQLFLCRAAIQWFVQSYGHRCVVSICRASKASGSAKTSAHAFKRHEARRSGPVALYAFRFFSTRSTSRHRMRRNPSVKNGRLRADNSFTSAHGNLHFDAEVRSSRFALPTGSNTQLPPSFKAAIPELAQDLSINCAESRHHCLDPRRSVFNFSRVDIVNLRNSLNRPRLQCSTALA